MSNETNAPDPRDRQRRDPDGIQTSAWKRTLEDMETIAEQRREDGWEVTTIKAAQTDTLSRDAGDHDRFGLFHVIPNNYADDFTEAYDPDAFTEYLAYGSPIGGFMFLVTELIDPDTDRSILIAGRYDTVRANGMVTSAHEEGVLYTHVKTIDGTILGTFEHEEYEPLLPESGR